MIRSATTSDIPRLVEMGLKFLQMSEYKDRIAENPDQQEFLMGLLISDNHGVLLVDDRDGDVVGMIGSYVHPHLISGDLVAAEVFLWLEPEYRGGGRDLIRGCEDQARKIGAKVSQMTAPNGRVGNLYEALGYAHLEAQYQKAL